MTRVLHTARISDVDSSMFVNRIRKMVSFELGKEIRKDVRLVLSIFFSNRAQTYHLPYSSYKPYICSEKKRGTANRGSE